jgi:predicted dehydrogenase
MEGEIRVAIVGMGKMGLVHSCVLSVLPNVKIVALCEKSLITRKLIGRLFSQALIVNDVEQLAKTNIDAVYVTTPIPSHFSVAKTIYSQGISSNVFIEKTLAKSSSESRKLCELSKDREGVNMVGYLRRYYVTFRKAKEMLANMAIGSPISFRAYAYSSDFLDIRQSYAPTSRGGVLRDLGCHAVDLALWFFGEMSIGSAKIRSIVTRGSQDFASFRMRSSDGVEGEIDVSWCKENYRMPEVGFDITGQKGTIQVNDDEVVLQTGNVLNRWYRHDLNDNVNFWLALPEYYREDLRFIGSMRNHTQCEPDFLAASQVDDILESIELKAEKS